MEKIKLTFILTVITSIALGQITTTKVTPITDKIDANHFDSTRNFLGVDVYKYIGQELYLNARKESLRKYGYDNFKLDYTVTFSDKSNVYKCCDNYNSKYNELEGKYFKVLEIIKHPQAEQNKYLYGKKFYLKLQEKESNDIVYYEYDGNYEFSFPFIVIGYFEKQKSLFSGKEFVFKNHKFINNTDIQTGKTVTIKSGQKWKCIDLTIEDEYYNLSLIFENSLGEKVANSLDRFLNGTYYTSKEADYYQKKFGKNIWNTILDCKVKIGMTKEMCRLSWGEPQDINKTITSSKISEQWVYPDSYLYFYNGILSTIQ